MTAVFVALIVKYHKDISLIQSILLHERKVVGAISPLINFDVVCLVVISARPVNVANGLYI